MEYTTPEFLMTFYLYNLSMRNVDWGCEKRVLRRIIGPESVWDITPCSPLKVNRRFGGTCSSEMSVDTQRTTRQYNPEDRTLHNHLGENLKSYKHENVRNFSSSPSNVGRKVGSREGEMDRAYITRGKDEKCVQNFRRKTWRRHHWRDAGLDGGIILNWVSDLGYEVVDWIHLLQDRDQRQAPLNALMNFRFPQKARNFLTSRTTVSFSRRTLLHGVQDGEPCRILSRPATSRVHCCCVSHQVPKLQ
jgi:hypothetical protein